MAGGSAVGVFCHITKVGEIKRGREEGGSVEQADDWVWG